jgi:hypothetical protein
MTNRGIITVSAAIKCEAVAHQCMWHVFVKRFMMVYYGLLLTSGMIIHIFNEEEMNDIN